MPRASWRGFLRLSLVSCPIYLSPATTRAKSIRLHQVWQPAPVDVAEDALSYRGEGVTLALDASVILAEAQAAGVHVALHGHQHKAKLATYMNLPLFGAATGNPIHVVSNGSAGAALTRLPNGESNSYCVFSADGQELRLRMRELRTTAQPGAELFDRLLQTVPALP
jgi:hypothetical protein